MYYIPKILISVLRTLISDLRTLFSIYVLGWVNFSEFEITVYGSCKMSTKKTDNFLFFNFFLLFCENP